MNTNDHDAYAYSHSYSRQYPYHSQRPPPLPATHPHDLSHQQQKVAMHNAARPPTPRRVQPVMLIPPKVVYKKPVSAQPRTQQSAVMPPPKRKHTIAPTASNTPKPSGIDIPTETDVLFGRGTGVNSHPGNVRYRAFIDSKRVMYKQSRYAVKMAITQAIVSALVMADPPARFLAKDSSTGAWFETHERKVLEKTAQALRQKKPWKRIEHTVNIDDLNEMFLVAYEGKRSAVARMPASHKSDKAPEHAVNGPAAEVSPSTLVARVPTSRKDEVLLEERELKRYRDVVGATVPSDILTADDVKLALKNNDSRTALSVLQELLSRKDKSRSPPPRLGLCPPSRPTGHVGAPSLPLSLQEPRNDQLGSLKLHVATGLPPSTQVKAEVDKYAVELAKPLVDSSSRSCLPPASVSLVQLAGVASTGTYSLAQAQPSHEHLVQPTTHPGLTSQPLPNREERAFLDVLRVRPFATAATASSDSKKMFQALGAHGSTCIG